MSDRFLVRHAPAVIAAAPLGAAVLGSLFNIWYNVTQVDPLLTTEQQARFSNAIILYNGVAYPILVLLWLGTVWPIHRVFRTLLNGDSVSAESLTRAQVRAINLPWFLGGVLALGWLRILNLSVVLGRELVSKRILESL
ncbi:MAG: hypothetical protein ACKVHE_35115 [Planctomycetales bacterium]|jgi:adenylate cyclase